MTDRLMQATPLDSELKLEVSLRPRKLTQFIGQKLLHDSLDVALEAARQRQEPLEHLLFYGPPGLGKTTLAHIIASELGTSVHLTAGPSLTRAGDLASLLTNLETGDILFIDEIHRMSKAVEETLYSAMEDFRLDIVLGKGPSARSVSLELKPFTLVGATTKYGSLSSPLRSRFGLIHKLAFYEQDELEQILAQSSKLLKLSAMPGALHTLALSSRGIPRIANRLLRRARDMAQIRFNGELSSEAVAATLSLLKIDALGLDDSDREVLRSIITNHHGGPVGIETIAATLSEDVATIEEVYEPFLLSLGLLARTKQGRIVTDKAYAHLGLTK